MIYKYGKTREKDLKESFELSLKIEIYFYPLAIRATVASYGENYTKE